MQRGIVFGVMRAVFGVAMLACMAAPGFAATNAAATKASVDLRKHPTDGKTPVDVSAGLYVTNIAAIDENRETFEVGGYLTGKWRDARLALAAVQASANSNAQGLRTFRLELLARSSGQITIRKFCLIV